MNIGVPAIRMRHQSVTLAPLSFIKSSVRKILRIKITK